MSDEDFAYFARMHDGRWSEQTKAMMRRFKTDKLNLNRAWAGATQHWSCPCCKRTKPEIARLTSSGVLLCAIESHHDHLGDTAGDRFKAIVGSSDDREFIIQREHAKNGMLQFVERFQRTMICIDCNVAETAAKDLLGNVTDDIFALRKREFSFSPLEIASFIKPVANKVHELNADFVRSSWNRVRPDIIDRMDFCERIARRFVNGKNRREVAVGTRERIEMDDNLIVMEQVRNALPDFSRGESIATRVLIRSVARDAVRRSFRPKAKAATRPITDADYARLDAANADQKHWLNINEDWRCTCCRRTKRELCRLSNKRVWHAQIHVLRNWIFDETEPNARYWRASQENTNLIIVDHIPSLVCQDCRHVSSEIQRMDDSVDQNALTIDDIAESISAIAPHQLHDIDYRFAIQRAHENHDIVAAVEAYHAHEQEVRFQMARIRSFMKRHRCPIEDARNTYAYEYAKAVDVEIKEGQAFMDWMIAEGNRFEKRRESE
ncbi:hypothetical protein [Mesorhizobium dulcispinae]|uniref:hypothetical protein n=1 Tax=Mesorhizobium dulcispinae TaxID=3072316 RepID=UPI002A2416FA|nr:hypothetical protein [Mesorhizobium sp. VK23D]